MAFPESALFTTKHLSFDRAGERGIDINHARLCASQGIEHSPNTRGLCHDVQLLNEPHTTLRIVTSLDRKTALTGYYLPTADAVMHREEYISKQQHAQGVEKARRTEEAESQAKTSSSKASQKEKQLIRQHPLTHDKKPDSKCPLCKE